MTNLAASVTVREDPLPAQWVRRRLRILFLASAHNSLSQRALVALTGVRRYAEHLARDAGRYARLAEKRRSRARDEQRRPLAAYRAEELALSHACFFGADRRYHEARRRFVYKLGSPCAVTG